MVNQVEPADQDKGAGDPQRAWESPEDNLLVRLRADVDIVMSRDHNAIVNVVGVATLDDRACWWVTLTLRIIGDTGAFSSSYARGIRGRFLSIRIIVVVSRVARLKVAMTLIFP